MKYCSVCHLIYSYSRMNQDKLTFGSRLSFAIDLANEQALSISTCNPYLCLDYIEEWHQVSSLTAECGGLLTALIVWKVLAEKMGREKVGHILKLHFTWISHTFSSLKEAINVLSFNRKCWECRTLGLLLFTSQAGQVLLRLFFLFLSFLFGWLFAFPPIHARYEKFRMTNLK